MRPLSRLLCLGLVVALASCSGGSTMPVVRDYTNGNPQLSVKPQSVVERCPPNQPCGGGGGDGGGGGGISGVYDPTNACAASESSCDFSDGDIDSDLVASDGGKYHVYSSYPWLCQPTGGTSFTSSGDGLPCSVWQIYHYFDQYCGGNTCQPVTMPNLPVGTVTKISISIAPIPSGARTNLDLGNAGHLYVQFWSNAWSQGEPNQPVGTALQAGPQNQNLVCCWGLLITQNYPVAPYSDARYWLPINVTANNNAAFFASQALEDEENTYQINEPCCAPSYYPTGGGPNSNTWVDALLLKYGYTQTQLNQFLTKLQSTSGHDPYGASNGSSIESLF